MPQGRSVAIFAAFLLAALSGTGAAAHPHVSVTVKTLVVLSEAGAVQELRHAWTFDEAFSAFSTSGLDTNKDGKLDSAELADLAKVNVESLSEYAYFTYLRKGKAQTGFGGVRDYRLEHDGKALTLHFTLPVEKNAMPLAETVLEVYDPSYFVAFEFDRTDPVKVEGYGGRCTASVAPPKPSVTERLSKLGEGFFQSLQNTGTAEWAIPVRFACK